MDLQAKLENAKAILLPLQPQDFDKLYVAASDPAIWEQHPNKNRWQLQAFTTYFNGAIQSKGAYKIIDKSTNAIVGCTRFYDYDEVENSILIGYTFYTTECWGTGINLAVKTTMLNYIFKYVGKVYFHIGANNIRSQKAITNLGAIKVNEIEVAYFGEDSKLNFVYCINKTDWETIKSN
jgi:N-acetyltransferase